MSYVAKRRPSLFATHDPRPEEMEGLTAVIVCEGRCCKLDDKGKPREIFTPHEFVRRDSGIGHYVLDGQQAIVRHIYRCTKCKAPRVYGSE